VALKAEFCPFFALEKICAIGYPYRGELTAMLVYRRLQLY